MMRLTAARGRGLALLLVALLACCMAGPDYNPPHMALPARFAEPQAHQAASGRLRAWWAGFPDPTLDRLVDAAIADSYRLRLARIRLTQARAERAIAAAGNYPTVNFDASALNQGSSTTLESPPGVGACRTYEGGFDASWELDLFGGTERATEAAEAGLGAAIEARRNRLVSLLSELAADCATLRSAQRRLAILRRSIAAEPQALQLTEEQFRRGLGTTLEVAQARAQLETVEAVISSLEAEAARMAHALGILVDRFPGDLEAELARPARLMPVPPILPAAVPSEVVDNRPDIREAERRYAAATAEIGVAVAQLFPRFSIPLTLDPATSTLHQLLTAGSLVWAVGLVGNERIYDGAKRSAQLVSARGGRPSRRASPTRRRC